MGGKVAMQFALDFPARVKKLVVVDMALRAYARSHDYIFAALLALDLDSFSARGEIEAALEPKIPPLNLRRFLLKNLGRDDRRKFFWKLNLRGVAENYSRLGAALHPQSHFEKPSLFLRGGQSDYVNAADETEIQRFFPGAEIQTMAAAAHWVHADAPEEFVRRTLDFLAA
jgi:esterase